jgi:hypothetical protein
MFVPNRNPAKRNEYPILGYCSFVNVLMRTHTRRTINSEEAAIDKKEKTWKKDHDGGVKRSLHEDDNALEGGQYSQLQRILQPWDYGQSARACN